MGLHVWTNHTDTVIAADIEDVRRVMGEQLSGNPDEPWDPAGDMGEPGDWGMRDDAESLTIVDRDEVGQPSETKICADWAKLGRGFLCSTEH